MLSRVADALFWMSRYLERAEHVARLLDVTFHLEFDLRGIVGENYDFHWAGLLGSLQETGDVSARYPGLNHRQSIVRYLTLDGANPNSITTCITRSRTNARSIRGSIPNEVWRELNKLYWRLRDPELGKAVVDAPNHFNDAVESGAITVQGVCDSMMPHDEGWWFIQLGRYLERLDISLRLIDVHHEMLRSLTDPGDLPLVNLHWGAVLRSCAAYHAYQRMFIGRVEPPRVVELLLQHPAIPRSARFCIETIERCLRELRGEESRVGQSKAERLVGKFAGDLRFADLATMVGTDEMHEFLRDLVKRSGEASSAVQELYSV